LGAAPGMYTFLIYTNTPSRVFIWAGCWVLGSSVVCRGSSHSFFFDVLPLWNTRPSQLACRHRDVCLVGDICGVDLCGLIWSAQLVWGRWESVIRDLYFVSFCFYLCAPRMLPGGCLAWVARSGCVYSSSKRMCRHVYSFGQGAGCLVRPWQLVVGPAPGFFNVLPLRNTHPSQLACGHQEVFLVVDICGVDFRILIWGV
jgi:hypothetical protein